MDFITTSLKFPVANTISGNYPKPKPKRYEATFTPIHIVRAVSNTVLRVRSTSNNYEHWMPRGSRRMRLHFESQHFCCTQRTFQPVPTKREWCTWKCLYQY